ncbi:MAG: hypothetical protein LBC99_10680 [Spirochaetota bacterium]|jgi:tetratricopeptide (TPR) repeat protein|nr:hypothetical protein [Spirochaetota bacterium]
MRRALFAMLLVLILWTGVFPLTAELIGDASFEGVVLSLSGVPLVTRGGSSFPIAPGRFIYPGEQIRLAQNDSASILMRTGRILELEGEGTVDLAMEFGQEEWFSQEVRDILHERFGLYDSELGRGADPSTNAFRQIYPYNSSVREGDAVFHWTAPAGLERFTVEIFEEDIVGNRAKTLVTREIGNEDTWSIGTDSLVLTPGQLYGWKVRAWDGQAWQETTKVLFRVLDKDAARRIGGKLDALEAMKKKDKQDITPWVLASILLMKEKLYHQALEQVAKAISLNDLSPFPYTLRGRIYEEMNLAQLALGEYQLAARLGY